MTDLAEKTAELVGAMMFREMILEKHAGKAMSGQIRALNSKIDHLSKQISEANKAPTWTDHAKSFAKPIAAMAVMHAGSKLMKSKGFGKSFFGKAMKAMGGAAEEHLGDLFKKML